MSEHNADILDIKTLDDAKSAIQKIGSDPYSIDIMAPKAISKVIKFENVLLQDAVIIKQDMLSIGGEVAVPKQTFELFKKKGEILIIGNLIQLRTLVEKLNRHYPRLKKFAKELDDILGEVF